MTITRKSIPRRTVLRGLGATVGLPLLDAMVPALSTRAHAAAEAVHRFQVFYVPNGMAMEYWTPTAQGRVFELTPVLEPLAPFRDQLLVVSGLNASWTAAHAGCSSFLSGAVRGGRDETELLCGVTVDQLLAQHFRHATQLGSLELSMDNKGNAGECSADLSCAYVNTISWRTPTMPLPMENNPRVVFERLFGDSGSTNPAVRHARLRQKRSILDSVTNKLADLRRELGAPDQTKLTEYAEAIRDVERRIQKAEEQSEAELPVVEQAQGVPADFEEHLRLLLDLQLLAWRTDLTRVITFMMGREQGGRTYPQIGVPDAHHPLSHHQNIPERIALMSKVNNYHARLFSEYLAKLRATPDGDGSLLDHMTVLYGCGISNSTEHSGVNLPILVAGGGAGRLKGGRHLSYSGGVPLANLLVTLMDKLDVPIDQLGNSTGRLPLDTLSEV